MFCIRHLNIVGVIDLNREEIIWFWGTGQLEFPHHPSLLENGNLLIFDNGSHRKYSRVIELNPVTKKIEWEYKANPKEKFYTSGMGGNQRFPNGNTLVTQSCTGRVFEVTKDGEIVWEFYNPNIRTETQERETIYRLTRIINPQDYPILQQFKLE